MKGIRAGSLRGRFVFALAGEDDVPGSWPAEEDTDSPPAAPQSWKDIRNSIHPAGEHHNHQDHQHAARLDGIFVPHL